MSARAQTCVFLSCQPRSGVESINTFIKKNINENQMSQCHSEQVCIRIKGRGETHVTIIESVT